MKSVEMKPEILLEVHIEKHLNEYKVGKGSLIKEYRT